MKGDFTRSTFRPQRHYRNVRMQQGRVQTDADWNEQADLAARRTEVGSADIIGSCGAPLENPGFGLSNGADPRLTAGHFYVNGILCENDAEIELDRQPDFPGFTLPATDGFYLAYLDAFEQHVTALEDPLLREAALGGPDTATRLRTAWQVKLLGPLAPPTPSCSTPPPEWTALVDRPPGGLRARTNPGSVSNDPCIISPGGGFRRLENQLYRVEIHTAGARGVARFKWSRDNGSIVTSWQEQQGSDLVVGSIGRDQVLGFAPGQTVEVTDTARELRGEPGIQVRLSGAEGQILKMDSTDPAAATVDKADFPDTDSLGAPNHPRVRRWDSDGALLTGSGWIALEDGVEVSFETGNYQVGDYWLIPARTATDDVEWPRLANGDPIPQEPHGVRHHYCRLAVLERAAGVFTMLEDCRPLFPSLTSLLQFSYLGGDGQESLPGVPLAQPLRVGVTLGSFLVGDPAGPLAGYKFSVEFTMATAGGTLTPPAPVPVVNGVAQCQWQLDVGNGSRTDLNARRSQTVTARLLDSAGTHTGLPPIIFNASLSLSSQVEYHPEGECVNLAGVTTVEQALDKLCNVQSGGGGCCISIGEGGQYPTLDDAFHSLSEGREFHICLCLMPGDHLGPEKRWQHPAHLRINGGAHSRLILRQPWIMENFASVTFENMTIFTTALGRTVPFIHFLNCGDVTIRNCQIITGDAQAGVLVGIDGTLETPFPLLSPHVLLENNQITAWRNVRLIAGAFENTPLAEAFSVETLSRTGFLKTEVLRSSLGALRVRDRRAIGTSLRKLASENAASLTEEESSALRDLADDFAARDVSPDRIEARFRAIAAAGVFAGRAIYINAPLAQVTLRSNTIFGEVSFHGPSLPLPLLPDELKVFLEVIKRRLEELAFRLNAGALDLAPTQGVIHLHGNRLTTLACGESMLRQIFEAIEAGDGATLGLPVAMTVSENTVSDPHSILAAVHIDMSHNLFAIPGTFVAACFAESGIYVGNRVLRPRGIIETSQPEAARAEAANLGIVLQP